MANMNVAEMKTMDTSVSAVSPQVPIISVTPHSPAGISINNVNKQYSVLGSYSIRTLVSNTRIVFL